MNQNLFIKIHESFALKANRPANILVGACVPRPVNCVGNSLCKVEVHQYTGKHVKEIIITVTSKGYYLERFCEMQLN